MTRWVTINGIGEVARHIVRMSPQLQEYTEMKGIRVEFKARRWDGGRK